MPMTFGRAGGWSFVPLLYCPGDPETRTACQAVLARPQIGTRHTAALAGRLRNTVKSEGSRPMHAPARQYLGS